MIQVVPRCMAGCLLIHVGIDLCKEALYDSYSSFDLYEYGSILIITITMTAYGMTAGLGAGVVLAAVTFTSQTSKHIPPIRGQMNAHTIRSTARRSPEVSSLLRIHSNRIHVIQLQGTIFFGNATLVTAELRRLLKLMEEADNQIWCIIFDFTLVLGIDSSAVETIAHLPVICRHHNVKVYLCHLISALLLPVFAPLAPPPLPPPPLL
jgi:sulfate permease, SulP family